MRRHPPLAFLTAVARMLARWSSVRLECVVVLLVSFQSRPGEFEPLPVFFPGQKCKGSIKGRGSMCRRELCKMGRVNKGHTAKGQKCGSNKVEKCSWPQDRRRHHKSTETNQAPMPIWLPLEVRLKMVVKLRAFKFET